MVDSTIELEVATMSGHRVTAAPRRGKPWRRATGLLAALAVGGSLAACSIGLIAVGAALAGGGGGGGSASVPPRVTFTAAPNSPYAVGTRPVCIDVGDFNGADGPDLAVTSQDGGTVSILLQNASGGFDVDPSPIDVGNPGTRGVLVRDFDGNGKLDFAVSIITTNTVAIYLGNGNGTFGHAFDVPVSNAPQSLVAGQFNPGVDLLADLAVVCAGNLGGGGVVSIRLGKVTGDFDASLPDVPVIAGDNGAFVAAVGSFDSSVNGSNDLVVANRATSGEVSVRLGDGTGHFSNATPPNIDVGVNPESVATGDFDEDGKLDFAVANRGQDADLTGVVSVEYGKGDGTFSNTQFTALQHSNAVAVADFDGDGHLDLAVTSFGDFQNQDGTTVSIYLGKGGTQTDGFIGPLNFTVGSGPRFVVARDVNGDGKPDLIVSSEGDQTVTVLLNTTPP